jgi:transcriptional regulator NrdR family protein
MICFNCGHKKTTISNSRYVPTKYRTWRRHTCPQCHASMTTHESIDPSQLVVGGRPFSQTRLLLSMATCLEHIPKKHRGETAEALYDTILIKLLTHNLEHPAMSPAAIANTVYATLRHYDRLASIQYAARHSQHLGKHLK